MLLLQENFTPVQQVLRSQREKVGSCYRRTPCQCSRSLEANGRFAPVEEGLHAGAAGPQAPTGGGLLLLQENFTPVQQVLRSQRREVYS